MTVLLLFLFPITDSIIPIDPTSGISEYHAGFIIENRYSLRELSGTEIGLWGGGNRFLISGFGLGPLRIYRARFSRSFSLIRNLSLGYGLSFHLYQFDDGTSYSTFGIDGGISYSEKLLKIVISGFDLNQPKLTTIDEIDPIYRLTITLGKNPTIDLLIRYDDELSLYTGFTIPISRVLVFSTGFQNHPKEFCYGISIRTRPIFHYSGSYHEVLGLSHRVGIRL